MQRGTQLSNIAKTSRLTENKRRYRARQKEYVSDLERRLAEAREQGIEATREVQLAARKVAVENSQLRDLLQLVGFTDEDINIWTRRGAGEDVADGLNCARKREIERMARRCMAVTSGREEGSRETKTTSLSRKSNGEEEFDQAENISDGDGIPSRRDEPQGSEPDPSNCRQFNPANACPAPESEALASALSKTPTCHGKQLKPCKLLSRLAENPATDITQVPVLPESTDSLQDDVSSGGDVECGKAYEMLMRYAVSEEKMDTVAKALEGGCTSTGKGRCAVKQSIMWEALDSMCG
jgi:hypothetical protein